ncbi:hypothetical protein F4861DRAFT_522368 [Xylaria intraflava]|nr:hypothetical protein F4861DRAFT_522368 [Xylaria intraflava]
MASSPPTQPPSPSPQSNQQTRTVPTDQYNNVNPFVHYVALGTTPLAILALALPPRRLDIRAVMLGGVAIWGTNQLTYDYSGTSFAQRFGLRVARFSGLELSDKAKETQARIRMEKEHRAKLQALRDEMVKSGAVQAKGDGLEGWSEEQKRALLLAYQRQREAEAGETGREKGVLQKLWMGDATPDWKEKRDQKEREALQEGGGGYWGLITDQIAEVWGSRKSDGGDASKGEKDNEKEDKNADSR